MGKVRWGVLGVASIAVRRAIPGMQLGEWCEFAAIASRDKRKAEGAAAKFGIPKAYGSYEALVPSNPRIFAHIRRFQDDVVLCVHNLARTAQAVELDLSEFGGRYPVEMLGQTRFPRIGELPYLLTLHPRGFFWFLLNDEEDHPHGPR